MDSISINYLAVLVAGVANMILGSIWYGPLFGKQFMRLVKMSDSEMSEMKGKGMGKTYFLAFVGSLITACVVAHFISLTAIATIGEAIELALWAWAGFVAVFALDSVLWEGKSIQLYVINAGYRLVGLVMMAIIFVIW